MLSLREHFNVVIMCSRGSKFPQKNHYSSGLLPFVINHNSLHEEKINFSDAVKQYDISWHSPGCKVDE